VNDQHKMELLKALREHGQTIQKMAAGGGVNMVVAGQGGAPTPKAQPGPTALSGPNESGTGGGPSTAHGVLEGLQDWMGTQSNFRATGANMQAGTNAAQLNTAYDNAQTGLGAQQNFLNALQAQNGIQNQNDIYNQMGAMGRGEGPNPAQAMLNQQTGNNVSNQAALMAGQRGAGANAGLMARQAALAGGNIQQNAIGQGAALQAQQSQNAINSQMGIAQNQINQQGQAVQGYNTAAQNEQNILQGANSAYNTASVSNQANLNNVNAQISQGNQSAGNGLSGGIMKGISSIAGGGGMFAEGGEVGEADVGEGNYTPQPAEAAPSIGSAGTAPDEGKALEDAFDMSGKGGGGGGGGGGGMSSMIGMVAALDNGGIVPQPFAVASPMMSSPMAPQMGPANGPKSNTGKFLSGARSAAPNIGSMVSGNQAGGKSLEEGAAAVGDAMSRKSEPAQPQGSGGGPSGSDMAASAQDADQMASGADANNFSNQATLDKAIPFDRGGSVGSRLKAGGKVPGKPRVGGAVNTLKNDTVPAMLSPGEVVIPRSIMQSKDPAAGAKKFIEALMKKKQQSGKAA
jgi:hypothetical protein